MSNFNGFVSFNSVSPPYAGAVPVISSNPTDGKFSIKAPQSDIVSTSTYTLDASNYGDNVYFNYAGTVTVTIVNSAYVNSNTFWNYAAASGTTLAFVLAGGTDALIGSTGASPTETGTIKLLYPGIFVNVPGYQAGGAGAGDVVGPASSTDTAIVRFNGTTGKLIQNSGITIDAFNTITTPSNVNISAAGAGVQLAFNATNTSNTANSGVSVNLLVGGASAASPYVSYAVSGGGQVLAGFDIATGDYCISPVTIGTNNLLTLSAAGALAIKTSITATNGNLILGTAGNKVQITTGANASIGTSGVMTGTPGAVTVNTTAVTSSSIIFVTRNTPGGTLGQVTVPTAAIVNGTSFVIQSNANETSTFNWWIVN